MRIIARREDGSAFLGLEPGTLRVSFSTGPAYISTLKPIRSGQDSQDVVYAILAVPPHSFLSDNQIHSLVVSLASHEKLSFHAAILSSDGSLSQFYSDLKATEDALRHAAARRGHLATFTAWQQAEGASIVALRRFGGRHVVICLQNPGNHSGSYNKQLYLQDQTFERLIRFDALQIYRLSSSLGFEGVIPSGDASSTHTDTGTRSYSDQQSFETEEANQRQAERWAIKGIELTDSTRREETIPKLVADLAGDGAGVYEVRVQPMFACVPGRFYPVSIWSTRPEVILRGPSLIQATPNPPDPD